jgi:hypothetical protein
MARRLNTTVHVRDEAGVDHAFAPGVPVPAWAAERITNPKVWVEVSDDFAPADQPEAAPEPPVSVPAGQEADRAPKRRRGNRRGQE